MKRRRYNGLCREALKIVARGVDKGTARGGVIDLG
jgi:hypothetical protein